MIVVVKDGKSLLAQWLIMVSNNFIKTDGHMNLRIDNPFFGISTALDINGTRCSVYKQSHIQLEPPLVLCVDLWDSGLGRLSFPRRRLQPCLETQNRAQALVLQDFTIVQTDMMQGQYAVPLAVYIPTMTRILTRCWDVFTSPFF